MATLVNNTKQDVQFIAEGCDPSSGMITAGGSKQIETGQTIFRIVFGGATNDGIGEVSIEDVPGNATVTLSISWTD